jgi:murein DD-endopeptidase MepM/ murein hydrolase activator NlpD
MRGGEPDHHPVFKACGGGFRFSLVVPVAALVAGTSRLGTLWGNRVTDLLRWGSQLFPESRSFCAIAKRTIAVSRGLLDTAANRGLGAAGNVLAVVSARRQPIVVGAATVIMLGATAYCAVGYLKYRHLAGTELAAAERAERANADLQNAVDRIRNEMAQAQARIEILNDEAKRQAALSDQNKADRVAQLTHALEQAQRDLHLADAQRASLVARLSKESTEAADGHAKQSQAETSLDQTQKKLQQLTAERDKAAGERDHFRARVNELEQRLSLLQTRQPPRPVAEAAPVPTPTPAPAAAAAVASAAAPAPVMHPAPAAEQPRQVTVVMPAAPVAEAPRVAAAPPAAVPTTAASPAAAPAVAAVDRGAFTQIERVLASAGVDVKHMFAQLGVNRGEGGPFIPPSAGQTAPPSPEKLAALRNLIKALPVSAPLESYELGSPFGVRGDPINGRSAYHTGVDLRAPYMTPVYATAAGVVTYSGYRDDYGKVVEIDHGNGISTRYAHLHRQTVSVGQHVAGHSQIGFLGSSGRATGPHVHYEVLVNGEPQDPEKFLGLARVIAAVQR